ncbi:MAG: peptidyl-prolyl cis-trans isomerase [Chitinivibrionales bacterium]|nr:peptidyl-prolyl cis-trans isomerase [Chitinivibrionales bacterium]
MLGVVMTQSAEAANPQVKMETSTGTIIIELDAAAAPKTVENFISYVNDAFYDGTIFHRVIPGFMIQGGGFTPAMKKKQTKAPVQNEADNGLSNKRGTIVMARTNDPHSATAQFFINTVDNENLDFRSKDVRGWGYCVFGKVIDGMDTVDTIENVKTGRKGPYRNVPVEPVVIEKVTLIEKSSEK